MQKPFVSDDQIESALLAIIQQRGPKASACPSEVARQLDPQAWRRLMPQIRTVAAQLAQQGRLEVAQRGKAVSLQPPWHGPIRIRLPSTDHGSRSGPT